MGAKLEDLQQGDRFYYFSVQPQNHFGMDFAI